MRFELTYKPFGERSILIEWPPVIEERILFDIIQFKNKLVKSQSMSIVELKSAYNSLLVIYDYFIDDFKTEVSRLKKIYDAVSESEAINSRLWKVPVCYDDFFGIDLGNISEIKNLSKQDIIKRHSNTEYTVYFIGFLPGFMYLGGLDKSLHMPRKATPRLKIERGTVAIGGEQTGVYPNESPGGWNVIGNTPVSFFDVSKKDPCFVKAGDKIMFVPITMGEHNKIRQLVKAGLYQLESELLNG